MKKIVCFRHPQYNGISSPDLSCRTCCTHYIEKISLQNDQQTSAAPNSFDASQWIENKIKDRRRAKSSIGGRFDPSVI